MKFKEALQKSVNLLSSQEFIQRVKEEDATMVRHLDILKDINKFGFLTINSQAGRKTTGKSVLDGKKYEQCERAYIMGFMQEKDAAEFIKQMSLHTDKNAVFTPYCEDTLYLPSSLDIPLTITKKEGKTTVDTHTSMTVPQSVWHSWRKQAHLNKTEKIVFLSCWDPQWNRNASGPSGLFTDILRILKRI